MKVIIAGYDKMMAALVNAVINNGHEIAGIIRIDRVKYNGFTLFFKDIFAPSKDFTYIKSKKLTEIKANSVNSKKFHDFVKKSEAEVILVGSWGEKFSIETIELTKYGAINCHPSILPNHRGANPYFWQIYLNEPKAGVTFHFMDEKYDAGEILMQGTFDIEPNMTGGMLKTKTTAVAEIMAGQLLNDLIQNTIIPVKQDETKATYDPWTLDLRLIDFKAEAPLALHNKIRGLRGFVRPLALYKGRLFKVKKSEIIYESNLKEEILKSGKTISAKYLDCTLKLTLL